MTRSPTRSRCASRAPPSSTSVASRPDPGRLARRPRSRSSGASSRSSASSPRRGIPVSIDTKNAVDRARRGRGRRRGHQRRLGRTRTTRRWAESSRRPACTFVAMHWRGGADVEPQYIDVVSEVRSELRSRIAELIVAGVDPQQIVIDPGLGFSKDAEHNWQLLVASRRARLARPRHPDRRVAQAVPRGAAAGGRAHRRARPAHRRRERARRAGGSVGRAGARCGRNPDRPRGGEPLGERSTGVNSLDQITLTGLRVHRASTACSSTSAARARSSSSTSRSHLPLAEAAESDDLTKTVQLRRAGGAGRRRGRERPGRPHRDASPSASPTVALVVRPR